MTRVLVDTGPLVALLNDQEQHHSWAVEAFQQNPGPLLTCEPVLTEAAFLVHRDGGDPAAVAELVVRGALRVVPVFVDAAERAMALMRKYADTPMSLADACLVVLAEQNPESHVFTLDTDFVVYRAHGRRRSPLLAPFAP